MPYELLKNNIKKNISVSDAELNSICSPFRASDVKKGDFLLTQGSACTFEGFVTEGCFKIFTLDKKGNENILYFAVKDWWLIDTDSFMNRTPSDLNMQALEDSTVLMIDKSSKEKLYHEFSIVEKLFRIMSQKAITAWQRRLIRNHSLTAKERYLHFVSTYPNITSKLTDRQIASYLGITHEFLSKIKRKAIAKE
ncbi:Crp/Fnr family transcriptional regulator [uncultured Maribacter sp.]|uniref:Crp/Fnr family transcriptional regulator n=1 Tax=uncultured Maribacter sp. TaxID=431308 RepID=UPI002624E7A7|nr:Crp/Fnr family transcriptional regulator [uncultured Maribacter sp.]